MSGPADSVPIVPSSIELDPSQRAVLELPRGTSAVVLGAPGTGKTTTAIELVADRVERLRVPADEAIVLTAGRGEAALLRDRLSVRLGVPTRGPLARTTTSFAFQILTIDAALRGTTKPYLLTGGEQDRLIAELLAGHLNDGSGPAWPEHLAPEVRSLAGFRAELRELFARAFELRLGPAGLAELGRERRRAEWVAAGELCAEYLDVAAQAHPGSLTAAELLRDAATVLDGAADTSEVAAAARRQLVVVDDVHELTHGAFELLSVMARRGAAVVGFGDPDVATTTFRGADPSGVARFGERLRLDEIPRLVLERAHRQPLELRALTARVTGRIGTALAGPQRQALARDRADVGSTAGDRGPAPAGEPQSPPRVFHIVGDSRPEQYSRVARFLREQYLMHGSSWSRQVVIVRSGAQIPAVTRALAVAEVPTRTTSAAHALRDDAAAAQLILAARAALGLVELDGQTAGELLLGPLGGLDAVTLRRLRLALRHEELAGGGTRSGDELLADALAAPGRFATIDSAIARRAGRLAGSLSQARDDAAQGASIEEVLWGLWERSGLSQAWLEQTRVGGIVGDDANRKLDGVVALFTSAKRFVERDQHKTAADYLTELVTSAVPEDTLAPRSAASAVLVTTPSGVAGLEFDVVVVAGLQEGVWPNLRPRGALLHPNELLDAASGASSAGDARKAVLDDELRMFALAVSRAREMLVLAATADEDERPSALLGFAEGQLWHGAKHPLTLRGAVGELRRLAAAEPAQRELAAAALALLARAGVPGADPSEWYGVLPMSTAAPLVDLAGDPEATVTVSPSKIEAVEASPLGWFIDAMSGGSSGAAAGIGTILHTIMEAATRDGDISLERIQRDLDARWHELGLEKGWNERRERARVDKLAANLHRYLSDTAASGTAVLTSEGGFQVAFGQLRISGKVDRVERTADGRIVIVDLKTGKTAPTKAEAATHAQLAAYQFAFREHGLDEALAEAAARSSAPEPGAAEQAGPGLDAAALGGAKLVYIAPRDESSNGGYREITQAPMDDDAAGAFWSRVEDAARAMAGSTFVGIRPAGGRNSGGEGGDYAYRIHLVSEVSA